MFEERLSRIRARIDGALAISLVARDGIPVESVTDGSGADMELLAAELMNQVQAISGDQLDLGIGRVRQYSIATDTVTIILGAVSDEYYLLVVLGKDGNFGRARYELRRAPLDFQGEL